MFQQKIPLLPYSSFKIGGLARYFYQAKDVEQLILAAEKARRQRLPIFVLGGGTNLLISDEGFDGLVLKPEIQKMEIKKLSKAALVKVGAGVSITQLLNYLIAAGLSGLEWAGGLPGTLGGAIRGNAGAFGGEMKDAVKEVISLDISSVKPKIIKRNCEQCRFGYRNSIFKHANSKEIILEAVLTLKNGDKKAVREAIEEKIKHRQERYPLEYPNVGSIFKNVEIAKYPKLDLAGFKSVIKTDPFPVIPAAYLISQAGLKGVGCGGAMVSPKHANFIVNALNAKAEDVKNLIKLMKSEVKRKFKIKLEEEIQYV